jgi:hypothetical protein
MVSFFAFIGMIAVVGGIVKFVELLWKVDKLSLDSSCHTNAVASLETRVFNLEKAAGLYAAGVPPIDLAGLVSRIEKIETWTGGQPFDWSEPLGVKVVPPGYEEREARLERAEARVAELESSHANGRWTVLESTPGVLSVCRGLHDKSSECEWEHYVGFSESELRLLQQADGEFSAMMHGRPATETSECGRLSAGLRALAKNIEEALR